MSLESILDRILAEAQLKAEDIIRQARQEAEDIIRQARQEAANIYRESIDREKSIFEKRKQKLIVQAHLEGKKKILAAKQELIDEVFKDFKLSLGKNKLKKQQVAYDKVHEVAEDVDFYLGRIRPDYEADIARILF